MLTIFINYGVKKILYLILILTSSAYTSYGQSVEFGTIFTINFTNPKMGMEFNLIKEKPYQGVIDPLKIDSFFVKNKPTENQIIGVFGKGKFGDSISTMLVLISGSNNILAYDLGIEIPNNEKFQKTSTSPLFKNVKSIEYWPYEIEKIKFLGFKVMPSENPEPVRIEEEVDSACIENADKNIKLGEQEFKSSFKSIIQKFEGDNGFKIDELLQYEKSINSKDVSLGHFWSLGEGIYPNKKKYKFGNPFTFKKLECPYFEANTDYFYTKAKGDVKVICFDWSIFEEHDGRADLEIRKNGHRKFTEKYDFLVGAVSELLGKPLAIEQEKDSGRIDTKWHSVNGINAYLFRFTNYDEIRLFIYKE
jgi:hypothetical protein